METIHDEAKGQVDEPHRHNYYTVIYVQKGEGRHLIDFQSYPLENNVVFFVSPGQIHQVYPVSRPKGWVITFSKEFLHHNHISEDFIAEINLFQSFEQRPPIHLDETTRQKIDLLMPLMEEAYKNSMPHQIAALSAYLKLFLVYCNQVCVLARPNTQPNDSGYQLLKSFKDLVTRHFRKFHKTSDYAKMLHISPKYLNQVVKSLIGQTAKEVIQEKIILNAKRELRYTDKPVKEIAFELGFEDPLYFSSFFKTWLRYLGEM
jgi:AraC-like DNA-binding protein